VPFEEAVVRQLTALDRQLSGGRIRDAIADRREEDVRRALLATKRTRPDDVFGYFATALGPSVTRRRVPEGSTGPRPLRSVEDPYAP
jgi:hypothetical protein